MFASFHFLTIFYSDINVRIFILTLEITIIMWGVEELTGSQTYYFDSINIIRVRSHLRLVLNALSVTPLVSALFYMN